MIWLGVDVETTGLDPKNDRVIEIGAVLYDTEKCKPLELLSSLVKTDTHPMVPLEITKLTGISDENLQNHARPMLEVLKELDKLSTKANVMVAHNASFDRAFLEEEMGRFGMASFDLPWVDTKTDVPFDEKFSRRLTYLAAEHGFINPFSHRALFDVLTMFKVIDHYDYGTVLEWSKQPVITIRALVEYRDRDKAKTLGYFWDGENKWWLKEIKEPLFDEEKSRASSLGFNVRRIS